MTRGTLLVALAVAGVAACVAAPADAADRSDARATWRKRCEPAVTNRPARLARERPAPQPGRRGDVRAAARARAEIALGLYAEARAPSGGRRRRHPDDLPVRDALMRLYEPSATAARWRRSSTPATPTGTPAGSRAIGPAT